MVLINDDGLNVNRSALIIIITTNDVVDGSILISATTNDVVDVSSTKLE